MKEKYCPVPISTCEFMNSEKADCNSCDLNKRYSKRTVDNWETYIVDNGTGREYGYNVDNILDLLNSQEEQIEQLKAQLQCNGDVCSKCKHEFLVPSGKYYISQCRKEHSECPKGTVKYCEDFELEENEGE